jgi:hypothetical protein
VWLSIVALLQLNCQSPHPQYSYWLWKYDFLWQAYQVPRRDVHLLRAHLARWQGWCEHLKIALLVYGLSQEICSVEAVRYHHCRWRRVRVIVHWLLQMVQAHDGHV